VAKISEAQFLRQVIDLAKLYRWRTAHFDAAKGRSGKWITPVMGDGKGFPDLVLVRGKSIIVAELKAGRNKTTPEQDEWLLAFTAAGIHAVVWRPEDWDEIRDTLSPASQHERR
jgi:hypothetical protein